jgi:hypothetical protein
MITSRHLKAQTSIGFFASVWTQIRAAVSVGLPEEEGSGPKAGDWSVDDEEMSSRAIRSMDDYAGYLTSNGLGSLDIGGGSSRWGE